MRKGFLSFMTLAVLFDNAEGGGGGGVERPETITPDEWQGLSEEEREGVLMTGEGEQGEVVEDGDDEPTDDELAAIAEVDAGADETELVDDAVAAASEPVAVADEPAAVVADAEPVTHVVAALPGDEELLQFRAVVKDSELQLSTSSEVPEELATKMAALEAQFEDAEVTQKDYQNQRDAINRDIINFQQDAKNAARDEARADKTWEKEQAYFLAARPAYLAGDMKGNAMFGALGEAVKAVSKDPKFVNASGMAMLVEADKVVRSLFNITTPAAETEPAAPPAKPAATRPEVKTLASVPAAAAEATGSDPFAPIDRLTGEAYEKALERLTPEQRAEYERRA
jgi:hypothetical protein